MKLYLAAMCIVFNACIKYQIPTVLKKLNWIKVQMSHYYVKLVVDTPRSDQG